MSSELPTDGNFAPSPSSPTALAFAAFRRDIDAALDAHIPRGGPVALLHYPYDPNVGNHLMWVAATDYLRERGIKVGFVAHQKNTGLGALRRAVGHGPILFLGGVTVSRLWPWHADLKRRVAAAFPENPLVSLPATVLFVDADDAREASSIFGSHPNVTVMTRDPVSGAQARAAFPQTVRVVTAPDLALRLPLQPRAQPARHDVLWLVRDDKEATGSGRPADARVRDWPAAITSIPGLYRALRVSGVLSRLRSSPLGTLVGPLVNRPMSALYRHASTEALRFGNRFLDQGRVLVTDRVHPHMMAALRGQHVVLLPDKFGKNRAVFDHYTGQLDTVHWADTPDEAAVLAARLASHRES